MDAQLHPSVVPGCDSRCVEADVLAAVLHRLRLSGLTASQSVALSEGLTSAVVAAALDEASAQGLVVERHGVRAGWVLTAEGRQMGEKLLQHQLDCAATAPLSTPSRRLIVSDAYEHFLALNQPMLELCTRWQVKQRDPILLNDHSDEAYDRAIIRELGGIHERVVPVCRMLTEAHHRFARYEGRLESALDNLVEGQIDWLTKPTVDSYHTIWFELHEDFLTTLGLDRASEHARQEAEDVSPEITERT